MQEKLFYAYQTAVIDDGCTIGKGTRVWHFCHIKRGCVIGEYSNIGQNVVISPEVILGRNVVVEIIERIFQIRDQNSQNKVV